MSSILKALKKLEEERTSTVDRPEQIARYAETPRRKGNRLKKTLLLLFCGVMIGVLSVGGWLLLGGETADENLIVSAPADVSPGKNSLNPVVEKETVRPEIPAGEVSTGEPAASSREPLLPQAVESSPRDQTSQPREETLPRELSPPPVVAAPPRETSPPPVVAAPPRETSPPPVVAAPPRESSPSPRAKAPPHKQPSPPAVKAPQKAAGTNVSPVVENPIQTSGSVKSAPALPDKSLTAGPPSPKPEVVEEVVLPAAGNVAAVGPQTDSTPEVSLLYKLTEIYHQDAGGSMAVMNDLPVMEGTMVGDAVVEKILKDRVRLIIDGKTVDILPDAKP